MRGTVLGALRRHKKVVAVVFVFFCALIVIFEMYLYLYLNTWVGPDWSRIHFRYVSHAAYYDFEVTSVDDSLLYSIREGKEVMPLYYPVLDRVSVLLGTGSYARPFLLSEIIGPLDSSHARYRDSDGDFLFSRGDHIYVGKNLWERVYENVSTETPNVSPNEPDFLVFYVYPQELWNNTVYFHPGGAIGYKINWTFVNTLENKTDGYYWAPYRYEIEKIRGIEYYPASIFIINGKKYIPNESRVLAYGSC